MLSMKNLYKTVAYAVGEMVLAAGPASSNMLPFSLVFQFYKKYLLFLSAVEIVLFAKSVFLAKF